MDRTPTIKDLLNTYYASFACKAEWDSVIAEDFIYVGGNMADRTPVLGKDGYKTVINRFSRLFSDMRVKTMIVDGDSACVIGNYDLEFPTGLKINADIAELWTAKDGKLTSLTIYFDTLTFAQNTPKTPS